MERNIDVNVLRKQITAFEHLLTDHKYPDGHILWGVLFILEMVLDEELDK